MSEQTHDGGDRALVLRLDLRPGRNLRWIRETIDESIPKGYALRSVQIKAFLQRDSERGRV